MRRHFLALTLCSLAFSVTPQAAPQKPESASTGTQGGQTAKPAAVKAGDNRKDKEGAAKTDEADAKAELPLLQQRGLLLIVQSGDEAASLSDKRTAARLQATAADTLWDHDQEKARTLFQNAFETALKYYRETGDDNRDRAGRNSFVGRADQRLEIIRLVKQHDTVLGKEFTERYIEEKKNEQQERRNKNTPDKRSDPRLFGNSDSEGTDLIEIAGALLDADVKAALDVARRAFAVGVSRNAPGFLARLSGKNRTAADELYSFALSRLAQEQMPLPGQLLLLSAYPFGEGRVTVSNGGNTYGMGFGKPNNFSIDGQLIQTYLTTSFACLTRHAEAVSDQSPESASRIDSALFAARYLEPRIEKFQPALLPDWQALTGRLSAIASEQSRQSIDRTVKDTARDQQEGPPPDNSDRLKSKLDQAEKAASLSERDRLYQEAAFTANQSGETARALDIADKITSIDYRRKVRSWINFGAAEKALREKRFDDARRYAREVNETDERAYLLFEIAREMLKDKDRVRATDLLNEAASQAMAADNTPAKIRALTGIANVFGTLDSLRAFEIANDLVKTVNRLKDYKVDEGRLVRMLESPDGGSSYVSANTVEAFDPARTLAQLARSDFDRALFLAQSFEDPALKLTSTIAIGASLFEKKPRVEAQKTAEK